jgi:hypothetical protein
MAWDIRSRDRIGSFEGGVTVSAQDDVAQFAALLRKLKERTDRSYGSLARRLSMNTSTLHRYCTGEAVPLDFAPVERFAALCGASSRERLELHRRWLLAVAARRRPRTGEATAGEPAGDRGAEEQAGDSEPAGGTAASGAPADEPVTGGEPVEPAGAGVRTRGPDGDGGPPLDAGVVSGPLPESGRPRPWYRRKRVAGAVAAACAVLAIVVSPAALPDGRSSPDDRVRADATPAKGAPTAASPFPSGSRGEDSTSGPAAPRRKPSGPSTGPSTPARPAPVGTPLTWTANSQVWAHDCGHDYVVAKLPAQVPPPPAPQDAGTWAATQSAVHGGETIVELSVQGTSDTAVVLTALRVRVAGRGAPAPANAYAMDRGCGGSLTPRHFAVDLDKDRPVARAVAGNDAGTPIPAVRMPYRVSAKDPEVLLVTARTRTCDCRWYLELDWSFQGRTGTVRIDDHGSPFRTRGIEGLPHYEYDTSARRWTSRTG